MPSKISVSRAHSSPHECTFKRNHKTTDPQPWLSSTAPRPWMRAFTGTSRPFWIKAVERLLFALCKSPKWEQQPLSIVRLKSPILAQAEGSFITNSMKTDPSIKRCQEVWARCTSESQKLQLWQSKPTFPIHPQPVLEPSRQEQTSNRS